MLYSGAKGTMTPKIMKDHFLPGERDSKDRPWTKCRSIQIPIAALNQAPVGLRAVVAARNEASDAGE